MKVTRETEAIMLLNVSFGKSDAGASRPLTPTEWGKFAAWLNGANGNPADLLECDLAETLEHWDHPKVTAQRVQALLNRGAALGFALEKWERAGLWVVTRSDKDVYPSRLKKHLRWKAPALLFGCGNRALLNAGGIAVVGSRHASAEDIGFAESIGHRAAECGKLIVSGGAEGVDNAAMSSALLEEGTAIGVLANNLLRAATSKDYRRYLTSGDLALVSPFNPEARFHVGNAMARNKYIYCMADQAIVVSSTPGKGGTWQGAVENLKKGWVPLAVKRTDNVNSGNPKLIDLGGQWLEGLDDPMFGTPTSLAELPQKPNQINAAVAAPSASRQSEVIATENPAVDSAESLSAAQTQTASDEVRECRAVEDLDPAEDLYQKVRSLVSKLCAEPRQRDAIAKALGVSRNAADVWLRRLVQERVLKKIPKPVRYVTCEKDLLSSAGEF